MVSRSENMRRVGNRNTAPEIAVRRILHAAGYRFRLHRRDLPGVPDIVLPKHRTAIFVHGCFWHGHRGCKRATIPATNSEFWAAKIEKNKARDAAASAALDRARWRVLTIWQCEIREEGAVLRRLLETITGAKTDAKANASGGSRSASR
jgi:DNA mismatch endonuclease (patch repair protein)